MSRQMDSGLVAALPNSIVYPAIFVTLTFKSSTYYLWNGVGNYILLGQTFLGVGSLGGIGAIAESASLEAAGTTVTLSGIDPALFQDCVDDIQLGAAASIQFALLTVNGSVIGQPYTLFAGQVDAPEVSVGADTLTVTLALENRLVDLARASLRRYTSADQRLYFPNDSAMGWVESLSDMALIWGS